jgi:hypothetical protein
MKKRFVLLLDTTTAEQNKNFLDQIKKAGFNWWHWIQDAWLLVDSTGEWTSARVRDLASEYYPGVDKLVLELRDDGTDTWGSYGPKTEKRDMAKWLKTNWKRS